MPKSCKYCLHNFACPEANSEYYCDENYVLDTNELGIPINKKPDKVLFVMLDHIDNWLLEYDISWATIKKLLALKNKIQVTLARRGYFKDFVFDYKYYYENLV